MIVAGEEEARIKVQYKDPNVRDPSTASTTTPLTGVAAAGPTVAVAATGSAYHDLVAGDKLWPPHDDVTFERIDFAATLRTQARAALWEAKWELLLPFFLLGGLATGVFSPVTAAAFTAFYVLFIEVFLYKDLSLTRDLPRIVPDSMVLVGAIFVKLCAATVLTFYFVQAQTADRLFEALTCGPPAKEYLAAHSDSLATCREAVDALARVGKGAGGLIDSPLNLRLDPRLVNVIFASSAGDEVRGPAAGGRPRLRIPTFVDIVNNVLSVALPPGCLVIIGVDVVLLAHNDSSENSWERRHPCLRAFRRSKQARMPALPGDSHSFRASQRDMKAPQKIPGSAGILACGLSAGASRQGCLRSQGILILSGRRNAT